VLILVSETLDLTIGNFGILFLGHIGRHRFCVFCKIGFFEQYFLRFWANLFYPLCLLFLRYFSITVAQTCFMFRSLVRINLTVSLYIPVLLIRGCIQKFLDWPPGARTANGTALCHKIQLYHYFVSQSSEFCHHNPLCCFWTSVSCCCLFHYVSVWKLLDTSSYPANSQQSTVLVCTISVTFLHVEQNSSRNCWKQHIDGSYGLMSHSIGSTGEKRNMLLTNYLVQFILGHENVMHLRLYD
jgi:hypothetical protein